MFNISFDPNKPITGKFSVVIKRSVREVFSFIGEQFFENYPKWATDVIEFEPLNGKEAVVGAQARQLRIDQGKQVASIFQLHDYMPNSLIAFKGVTAEYRDSYVLDVADDPDCTCLTYTFELLNLELFMRPFEKLIRIAIEDGAETTVENIKNLLHASEQS